jgi:hypothetical protein
MQALGIGLIIAGVILFFISPRPQRPQLKLTGLRVRGIAGPVLVIIGILILLGVIPG